MALNIQQRGGVSKTNINRKCGGENWRKRKRKTRMSVMKRENNGECPLAKIIFNGCRKWRKC